MRAVSSSPYGCEAQGADALGEGLGQGKDEAREGSGGAGRGSRALKTQVCDQPVVRVRHRIPLE